MSVINILMQLRKVCNHPNLFDPRPIQSPFITQPIVFRTASLVQDALEVSPFKVSLESSVRKCHWYFSYILGLIPIEECILLYYFFVSSALRPFHVWPNWLRVPEVPVPGRCLSATPQGQPPAHSGDCGVSRTPTKTQTSPYESQQVWKTVTNS